MFLPGPPAGELLQDGPGERVQHAAAGLLLLLPGVPALQVRRLLTLASYPQDEERRQLQRQALQPAERGRQGDEGAVPQAEGDPDT